MIRVTRSLKGVGLVDDGQPTEGPQILKGLGCLRGLTPKQAPLLLFAEEVDYGV